MNDSWKSVVFGAIGVTLSFGVYQSYKLFKTTRKQYETLKNTSPVDVTQFKRMKKKEGDFVVVRVVPDLEDPAGQQYDLCTNHETFSYPDERIYLMNKTFEQQKRYKEKVWKGHDAFNYPQAVELKGLGHVFDGVLEILVKPMRTLKSELPWYKQIYKLIAETLESILGVVYLIFAGRYRSFVFFKGVKVGDFDVKYNWFKGHVLVECEIGSQKSIQVRATSLSQDALIQDSDNRVSSSFKGMLVMIGFWMVVVYNFQKYYRRFRKRQQGRQRELFDYRQLSFEPESQDQTCIICMTNNRNVISEQCCHLLICSACLPHYNKNECPLCKGPFDVKKVYAVK